MDKTNGLFGGRHLVVVVIIEGLCGVCVCVRVMKTFVQNFRWPFSDSPVTFSQRGIGHGRSSLFRGGGRSGRVEASLVPSLKSGTRRGVLKLGFPDFGRVWPSAVLNMNGIPLRSSDGSTSTPTKKKSSMTKRPTN